MMRRTTCFSLRPSANSSYHLSNAAVSVPMANRFAAMRISMRWSRLSSSGGGGGGAGSGSLGFSTPSPNGSLDVSTCFSTGAGLLFAFSSLYSRSSHCLASASLSRMRGPMRGSSVSPSRRSTSTSADSCAVLALRSSFSSCSVLSRSTACRSCSSMVASSPPVRRFFSRAAAVCCAHCDHARARSLAKKRARICSARCSLSLMSCPEDRFTSSESLSAWL
mmetsp:Transcript_27245/g.66894  ORF Transcript_27245/g.66894 Transcript_27245/m.66894 type:complete len:221 (-) Transcript_27245:81-743(-)